MTLFEKVTQSPEALVDWLTAVNEDIIVSCLPDHMYINIETAICIGTADDADTFAAAPVGEDIAAEDLSEDEKRELREALLLAFASEAEEDAP